MQTTSKYYAFAEVTMFLATQLADEGCHIDVFLKRARMCGRGLGISSVITFRSLLSLLQTDDFTEAAFLLSVPGDGTFLDLLTFIQRHAPDEPTAELTRRAKSDESRHVHFGLAHVRYGLANDPGLYNRLEKHRAKTRRNTSWRRWRSSPASRCVDDPCCRRRSAGRRSSRPGKFP